MSAEPPTNPPDDEQDSDEIMCRECGTLVYLSPDVEWPKNHKLCFNCLSWTYDAGLKIIVGALTAEQDAEEQEE